MQFKKLLAKLVRTDPDPGIESELLASKYINKIMNLNIKTSILGMLKSRPELRFVLNKLHKKHIAITLSDLAN